MHIYIYICMSLSLSMYTILYRDFSGERAAMGPGFLSIKFFVLYKEICNVRMQYLRAMAALRYVCTCTYT